MLPKVSRLLYSLSLRQVLGQILALWCLMHFAIYMESTLECLTSQGDAALISFLEHMFWSINEYSGTRHGTFPPVEALSSSCRLLS